MRLKSLTTCTTFLLLAVCLALGATLWWSERALAQPYLLMTRYLALSQLFQQRVATDVQVYLETGDALRHSQAMRALDELTGELDALPPPFAAPLQPSLVDLRRFAGEDLLAAGKLAGDPQGLLVQAERELAAVLASLQAYAREGQGEAYLSPLLGAALDLKQLSQARERLMATRRDEPLADAQKALTSLERQAREIQALPLLGVVERRAGAGNGFAALLGLADNAASERAEDRGVALKRELAGLIQRYPMELERTRQLIGQRVALSEDSNRRIVGLQQALDGLRPLVNAEHGRIQAEVRWIQGMIIFCILAIALLVDRLQRRLSAVLAALVPALSAWGQGDFSRQLSLDSKIPEIVAMEQSLSRLRNYLADLIDALRVQADQVAVSSQDLSRISHHLHDGARHQASETAQIRDSLAQLESTIAEVAAGADEAALAGRAAARAVDQGQRVIGQSLGGLRSLVGEVQLNAHAIERLADETSTIGGVLTVIRSIAEQTNLLALNAAIEAARAGSQGRGFAVVAEEVRSLAQRTGGATEEIQQLIARLQLAARQSVEAMQAQVEHAETTAAQAGSAEAAMAEIVAAIDTIGSMAERIAHTTSQQHLTVSEVRSHSERIFELGDSNLGHIDQSRAQSEQLSRLGRDLDSAVKAISA
ncbi:methyl-accepting chemotaxis protein [Stutzerimonas tarimensis]|uniref:Methyl-accepting chemotaxis protein n=1 Tax=Stutzerimonas tarimensis TaxID=1507735 RepID=A0ABV7T9X4_9GAMM